jgi:hypothetical protein
LESELGVKISNTELDALRSNARTDTDTQRLSARIGAPSVAHLVKEKDFPILFDTRFDS